MMQSSAATFPAFEVMKRRPGSVDLFAFTACIGVAHRIHYDQEYSREREGHPNIVVPGPLQASYICQTVRRWMRSAGIDGRIASLKYRHRKPVYVDSDLEISGDVTAVDEESGRVVCSVWTRVAGEDGPATEGEAVIALRR